MSIAKCARGERSPESVFRRIVVNVHREEHILQQSRRLKHSVGHDPGQGGFDGELYALGHLEEELTEPKERHV